MAQVELPTDYYLTNFCKMLNFVYRRYRKILDQDQADFYHRFHSLSSDARMLLVRLLMRKGDQFRLDNLKYDEISERVVAGTELIKHQLAQSVDPLNSHDWTCLFNKSELIALFEQDTWKRLSRPQLNVAIESFFLEQKFEHQELKLKLLNIRIIRLDRKSFDMYRLLFFGNLNQDLTEFVLQDLGLLEYESYLISDDSLPFESQQQLLAHRQCYELSEQISEVEAWTPECVSSWVEKIPSGFERDPHLNRRRSRIILCLARQYERLKCYRRAIETYRLTTAIPSKERQIRCLDKMGEWQVAFDELELLLRHSTSDEERQFAEFFLPKVAKKLGFSMSPNVAYLPPEDVVILEQKATSVEVDSIAHLSSEGTAYWLENSLFNTLFALIYWDVLFADSPGAFFNPFQMQPSDMYLPEFKSRRNELIEKLHEQIQYNDSLTDHISKSWHRHSGKACRFAHWGVVDKKLIEQAIALIPEDHIKAICLRILDNPKENRNGMPDLLFFPESGGYQLIEIKGPGDKLQKNQLRWLSFYHKHNIPHRVMRVEWNA